MAPKRDKRHHGSPISPNSVTLSKGKIIHHDSKEVEMNKIKIQKVKNIRYTNIKQRVKPNSHSINILKVF